MKGLQLAIDLARRHRDEASAKLVQAQRACIGAQGQMVQLESYAAETESTWALGSRASASARPEIVRHYDQFMDRLQQAVDLQRAVVHDHLRVTAGAKHALLELDIRMAALQRLLEKRQSSMVRAQASLEQKQLDELSALQFRRLHAGADTLESR
jgi:flagellar FliJ protein